MDYEQDVMNIASEIAIGNYNAEEKRMKRLFHTFRPYLKKTGGSDMQ